MDLWCSKRAKRERNDGRQKERERESVEGHGRLKDSMNRCRLKKQEKQQMYSYCLNVF